MEAIRLESVSFKYPDESEPALEKVSVSIGEGELVLLCGRSGSGKSTLLRLIKRQLAPHGKRSGEIFIFGQRAEDMSERDCVSRIGFVMQGCDSQIVTGSVSRELAFGLESLGINSSEIRRRMAETCVYFGLEKIVHRDTDSLSGGEKQLVTLASAAMLEPMILLLDEPTAQLDPIAAKGFTDHVLRMNKELGVTVVIAEHSTETLFAQADRIIALEKGRVICDAAPYKAASDKRVFFGALPEPVRLYRSTGERGGSIPLTAAQAKQYIRDNFSICKLSIESDSHQNSRETILSLKDVYFRYGKKERDVLCELDLSLHKGEILTIIGGNGSGKSTLLKLISGVEKPYSGRIKRESKNQKVSMLPQDVRKAFLTSSVREDIRMAAEDEATAKDRQSELCSFFGITHLLDRHPYDLSGGERQKAALAKLLMLSPDVLLLDEPTKGMDYESRQGVIDIMKRLKSEGQTIIAVTHDTELAAECSDRCAFLFDGRIVSEDIPERFFTTLRYCTTASAQIARGIFENAVTHKQLTNLCLNNRAGV